MRAPGPVVRVLASLAASACGPGIVEGAPDTGTSSGVAEETGATTGAVSGSEDGIEPDATTGADDGGLCWTNVELEPFAQIHETSLLRMQVYDFDVDGLADLVGAKGVIALQRPEGFELLPSPEPIESSECRAGRFDGDDVPDLLCAISDFRLRLHAGGAAEPAVDTLIDDVTGLEPGDMNGDGIDDLVVTIDQGSRIEAWRGTEAGVFELTASTSWPGLAHGVFVALEPPRIDLVVTDLERVHVLVGDGAGGFAASDSVSAPSSGLVQSVREGDRDVLLLAWAWSQLDTSTGVGVLRRDEGGGLSGRSYDLSPRWLHGSPAAVNLDEADSVEIVAGVDDPDGPILEVACPRHGEYARCGTASLAHAPQWLAFLPDESGDMRIAYSTIEDGTWIAPIAAHSCLGPKG